jgi:hypothetical protein
MTKRCVVHDAGLTGPTLGMGAPGGAGTESQPASHRADKATSGKSCFVRLRDFQERRRLNFIPWGSLWGRFVQLAEVVPCQSHPYGHAIGGHPGFCSTTARRSPLIPTSKLDGCAFEIIAPITVTIPMADIPATAAFDRLACIKDALSIRFACYRGLIQDDFAHPRNRFHREGCAKFFCI